MCYSKRKYKIMKIIIMKSEVLLITNNNANISKVKPKCLQE